MKTTNLTTTSPSHPFPCLLIRNIPSSFHTADLRRHFSTIIESGEIACAQYKHRKEECDPGADPSLITHCCLIQLSSPSAISHAIKLYHNQRWRNRDGDEMDSLCMLRKIWLDVRELPQGVELGLKADNHTTSTVATKQQQDHPYKHLQRKRRREPTAASTASTTSASTSTSISTSTAPSSSETSTSTHPSTSTSTSSTRSMPPPSTPSIRPIDTYHTRAALAAGEFCVPPELPQGTLGTPTSIFIRVAEKLPASFLKRMGLSLGALYTSWKKHQSHAYVYPNPSSQHLRMTRISTDICDDDNELTRRRYEADVAERLLDYEEWDIGEASAMERGWEAGRGLEMEDDGPVFESKIENPWDKQGADALVHYTDQQYWNAEKGDFDEQTSDTWDVDVTERMEEAMEKRMDKQQYKRFIEYGEVPVRVFHKMGYKGGGLGRLEQGITRPIQAKPRADRVGLGYEPANSSSTSNPTAQPKRTSNDKRARARERRQQQQQRESELHYIQTAAVEEAALAFTAAQEGRRAISTIYDDPRTDPRREWTPRDTDVKRARRMGSFRLET